MCVEFGAVHRSAQTSNNFNVAFNMMQQKQMCVLSHFAHVPLDGNNFFNLPFCPSSPERTKKRQNSVLTTHHLFCLQHFGLNIRQREDLKSQKMCQMTWRIFLNILEYFWDAKSKSMLINMFIYSSLNILIF